MSDYTPTTGMVRARYCDFDRWLEQHSEAIRADEREKVASAIEAIHPEMSHQVLITERRQALYDGMRYAAEIARSGGNSDE